MKTMIVNEVLDVAEAAQFLRVCEATIYRRCRAGEIPHLRIGGQLRFSRSTLEAWVAEKSFDSVKAA